MGEQNTVGEQNTDSLAIELRSPTAEDGAAVSKLVSECPPLDPNSMYCNLLQCSHFSDTSVAAVIDGELIAFISGYILPKRMDTLFIWQVAVSEKARGKGIASRMSANILKRSVCVDVRFLETSVTETNKASWSLFEALARNLDAEFKSSLMFDRRLHFAGQHDTEHLVRIGPFSNLN